MTCCRAEHPEELTEQIGYLEEAAQELDRDFADYEVAYQVTMNIGDSEAEAKAAFDAYISQYYPELSQAMDLSNWGPVGTPDQIAEWLREFADRGVTTSSAASATSTSSARSSASPNEVLPAFQREIAR